MKKILNLLKFKNKPPLLFVYYPLLIINSVLLYFFFFRIGWIIRIIIIIILLVIALIIAISNRRYLNQSDGNGIIYGGRGAGKGVLLQKKANSLKKNYSNVPLGDNTEIINIRDYIQSIGSNTILDSINGTIKQVKKIEKYEGVPVFVDDTTIYFPNFEDKLLKSEYPSLPLTLAINRHLYDSYMIITTQDLERPYKVLRELQTDFYIKALKTKGFGRIWSSIPFLRNFISVKYLYYENQNSAIEGILPFKGANAVGAGTKDVYMTAGTATKEQFKAKYGNVSYGRIFMSKNRLYYDTRYFHQLFFGKKAPIQ